MPSQANIYPHTVLSPTQQGPGSVMGPLTGMSAQPDVTLRPLTPQRIPTELARMILLEQKNTAPRGIVKRRTS